jgi:hypothetical protein
MNIYLVSQKLLPDDSPFLAADQASASSLNYKLLAPIYQIIWHHIPDE